MNVSKLAPVGVAVLCLGLVGGVAATQAFSSDPAPSRVQLVQPAAETVTPTPTATTTTAPAVVATKTPVPSKTSTVAKKAPAPVQRQAVVSETAPQATTEAPAQGRKPARGNPVGTQVNDPYATPSPDGSPKE